MRKLLHKNKYLVVDKEGKVCYVGRTKPDLELIIRQNYDISYNAKSALKQLKKAKC